MEPLFPERPAHPLGCHSPRVRDRDAMNAILFVLRTGMQWNALSATGICSCSSAYRRFREWAKAGVFLEFWRRGLLAYDDGERGECDERLRLLADGSPLLWSGITSDVTVPADEPIALSPPTCAECGRPRFSEAERWSSCLTVDNEARLFCVDCAEREFASE